MPLGASVSHALWWHWQVFIVAFLVVVALLTIAAWLHEWWEWRRDR